MTIVTIHEAKSNLSKLIKLVEASEEVVIARGEKPVARILAISPAHGNKAGFLPGPHRDQFDRLLAAQSIIEDMPIMTADAPIRNLGVRVLW